MRIEQYIDELFTNGGMILAKSLNAWRAGIDYEVDFWSRWFETRGREWPDDFVKRTSPQPLAPWLVELLPAASDRPARILDVGAGPITVTGYFVEGRKIAFTAVDPLAHFYDRIIDKHQIQPPVRTQFAFAEDLSARFDHGSFHLISCTNALDHAMEPVWGIIEMLNVAAPAGKIFLGHRRNEAEFENYSGFHQWNFDVEEREFVIWNRERRVNVSQLLAGIADIKCRLQGDYLVVTLQKRTEVPGDPLQYHRRMRAGVLESLLARA